MSPTHDLFILVAGLGLCIAQTGCVAAALEGEPAEEQVGAAEEAFASINRLSMNRLSMNRLSMNRLSMNGLSSRWLSPRASTLSSTELIATAEGRELLAYVIRCALPEGQSLSGAYGGVTYTFQGVVGLAPEWRSRPLAPVGQRWVTACLLAHVNGYGAQVLISLRGEHAALEATSTERAQFDVQEAAFYGNLFDSGSDDDDDDGDDGDGDDGGTARGLYACAGATVQAQCGATSMSYMPRRSCSTNGGCALSFAGPCRDEARPARQACENTSAEFVEDCFAKARGSDDESDDRLKYPEVITVYLNRDDFNTLYADCAPLP
ncbi:uncharacterized protein SOCE26_075360 [Sorangium cellulosum]|uniref:Uncharacterized protein n=1 Tax=Sorangium cellulosum TaxID=56 RepID=A0A2L0F3C5_SORCE|nr:hypothetical protein [Sorangium cellulosum]AUX46033.1 uncharacterized protein SOCE26_075360 [Sorangium cellulosum]